MLTNELLREEHSLNGSSEYSLFEIILALFFTFMRCKINLNLLVIFLSFPIKIL
jgi:hypothetical protein